MSNSSSGQNENGAEDVPRKVRAPFGGFITEGLPEGDEIECFNCGHMVAREDLSHKCKKIVLVPQSGIPVRQIKKLTESSGFAAEPLGIRFGASHFLTKKIPRDSVVQGTEFPTGDDGECQNDSLEGIYPDRNEWVGPEGGLHPFGPKSICDPCFSKVLLDFSQISKGERESGADFEPISKRFTGGSDDLDWAWRNMRTSLGSIWVHQGNAEAVAAEIGREGREKVREFHSRFYAADRQQVLNSLRIPEVDPEADNEPSAALGTAGIITAAASLLLAFTVAPGVFGGMIWVGLAMVLINGHRLSKWDKLREAVFVESWEPTRIFETIDKGIRQSEKVVVLLAKVLVQKKLSDSGESSKPSDWASSVNYRWNPLGPLPVLPVRAMTPLEAEDFVKRIVSYLGESGAATTRYVQDGGIDVISDHYAIQVKHEMAKIGPSVVRETFGVATSLGKKAGVFAKSGFTKSAVDFANENGVTLLTYEPSLAGESKSGREALARGLTGLTVFSGPEDSP